MDAGILEQVLCHIHNWFERERTEVADCEIENGSLPASITSSMMVNQWYRIEGSYLNDGLHKHPADDLTDETFSGSITKLAIPRPLLYIVQEIEDWLELGKDAREKALASPYQSESFDGYSYSLRGDLLSNSASGGSTGLTGWQAEFASRLNPWRKMA